MTLENCIRSMTRRCFDRTRERAKSKNMTVATIHTSFCFANDAFLIYKYIEAIVLVCVHYIHLFMYLFESQTGYVERGVDIK